MNKRNSGKFYEDAAVAYIEERGVEIIERNIHMGKIGEVDIIGMDRSANYGETLVFFEIKYRKDSRFGTAAMAVNDKKKRTIRKCAMHYIAFKHIRTYIRFDVIAIDGEQISWIKNAF